MVKWFSLLTLGLVVSSCDKDDDDMDAGQAQVMVVHASPDAPNVDV